MTLVQLKHLIELANSGSFSQSALKLHLTQPALSRSIKALEDEMGRLLFDRIGKRIELTSFGQEVLIRSQALVEEAEQLKHCGRQLSADDSGRIRLGLSSGPGALLGAIAGVLAVLDGPPGGERPHRIYNIGNNKPERVTRLVEIIEQAVEPLFKGKRLMALAHFQQAHGLAAQCRAVLLQAFKQALKEAARVGITLAQAQPQAAPMLGQRFAKLDRQGAFAKACRRTDQQ